MSSSALVSSMKRSSPRRTVSGEPTNEQVSICEACAFSAGDQKLSISSIGGWSTPRVPAQHVGETLLDRGEQPARFLVGVGDHAFIADHGVGPVRAAPTDRTWRDRPAGPASGRRARNARRRRRAGPAWRRAGRRTGSSLRIQSGTFRPVPAPPARPGPAEAGPGAPESRARPGENSRRWTGRGATPRKVRWSVPGARPSPRSMRPG